MKKELVNLTAWLNTKKICSSHTYVLTGDKEILKKSKLRWVKYSMPVDHPGAGGGGWDISHQGKMFIRIPKCCPVWHSGREFVHHDMFLPVTFPAKKHRSVFNNLFSVGHNFLDEQKGTIDWSWPCKSIDSDGSIGLTAFTNSSNIEFQTKIREKLVTIRPPAKN